MKRLWSADELDERWTLSPGDLAFITVNADAGRLGLASQLAFWRSQGRFPDEGRGSRSGRDRAPRRSA